MKRILVLHGINLNMFGRRDSTHYGNMTLTAIDERIQALAAELGVQVECFQSNREDQLVERIHRALDDGTDAVVINAGAWTHYNYAIRDALEILKVPVVEVHMSNIHARESFRATSVLAPVVRGQISGFGVLSYLLGLRAAVDLLEEQG
ncbi:MAG: type II 3-dehydroquinate dehydratase [Desulfacinum sp.]|jgi:3-dehydroquinate dehydratase-2|nr:type II 3-dehydroquinate dehydratase [Desulfacinum sp.]